LWFCLAFDAAQTIRRLGGINAPICKKYQSVGAEPDAKQIYCANAGSGLPGGVIDFR
jgi:hypothetical protein